MDRRTFLKVTGMGSVAFAAGCNSHPERKLYSLVRAPEDMVTGEATWYASTCRECPAGCGILAKNREGRAVKLEGNPLHPVNQGRLCARGHAALQRLYHPDRIRKPLIKVNNAWEEIPFDQAAALIQQHALQAAAKGPGRVAMMTEAAGSDLLALFGDTLSQFKAQGLVIFEPLAYESLKFAHARLFGRPILPAYRMDQADLILGFGADFLETWLSPVEYGRKFKAMHAQEDGQKGLFLQVSPFQSLTGANADRWLMCRPGSEAVIAMALIRQTLAQGRGRQLPDTFRRALVKTTDPFPALVSAHSGLSEDDFNKVLRRLLNARRPLVLPTATASGGTASAAADLASVLLNAVLDPAFGLYDFDQRHRVEIAHPRSAIQAFWQRLAAQPADLLLLNNVNPVYALPSEPSLTKALARPELFVVAFSNMMDETAAVADLIVPVAHALESWDAYESKQGMLTTLQPVLGDIGAGPHVGDFFLKWGSPQRHPAQDYRQYLVQRMIQRRDIASHTEWLHLIQNGGRFVADRPASAVDARFDTATVDVLADMAGRLPDLTKDQSVIHAAASLRFFDGRCADRPWLSEIPDPITQVAWQTTALLHPQTLFARGWSDGQLVQIRTAHGQIELQVYGYAGMHPSMVVIPLGQGHSGMGRYAKGQGVNPVGLLGALVDPLSGAPDYTAVVAGLEKSGPVKTLASVSGHPTQLDRKIALSVPLDKAQQTEELGPGLTMNDFPFTLPLAEGYDRSRDFYPPHAHEGYRWGMTVDLDRCIGCSACVATCYAENNVGLAGEDQIIRGREMAWIRIERYQDPRDPTRLIFLPMLCQHCDNAPCESVCPVYAPHHSKEGLNNQIYNRCIGTRFCAQNCPYKMRRFNWFDWQWPEPLNMQLNPDVTVRSKGVMEKCSFCIQRIKAAHNLAKNEDRPIRDGEVMPACMQTCPTDAILFGNLLDPDSAVRKRLADPRAYQVMGYLNTKPAVIYLKKVVQEI
ncbi:MAG: 4Fe-4S dicluster domain-containing protein [Desulfobacteraceae bacterium]|nr:MAG: 4Fe-4S dicluster domain-containing protein [Desulfobacteraceae bacterium]